MGSIALVSSASGAPPDAVLDEMITVAAHRGGRVDRLRRGPAAIAVASSDRPDAFLGADDDVVVGIAGVVDNISQLADEAAHAGAPPRSPEPADVLVAAYRAFGADMPARMRGVFTGAIVDGAAVLGFRDQLGFGPAFFRRDARGFVFATEAKQVVAGAGIAPEPDVEVCEQIFYRSADETTPSALRGVERIPKASIVRWDGAVARLKRYWDPTDRFESGRYGPDELRERFDELMDRAVTRTLTGRDAVSLSGGVDSPAIAAYGAPRHVELSGRPLGAVSVVYPEHPSVDESTLTKLVADELGMPLDVYEQRARPMDRLDEWAKVTDGPVPTISLPQYEEHYRIAHDLGYRGVLSGEFAEFVFDISTYLIPHLVWHGRWSAVARLLADRRARGGSIGSVFRSLANPFVPTRLTAYRWARSTKNLPPWLDRGRANAAAVKSIVRAKDRWGKVQLSPFSGVGITVEADDVCQHLCDVRARRPWADVDLWEFFLSLPGEVKFPDTRGKTLVRGLLRGRVPDAILDRRDKTYFDEAIKANIDYPALRRWLSDPADRLPGVRYDLLRERIESGTLELAEFGWAKDLASVHAFLSHWR
jgi:asparagine synthase (glutamine-hydrolysing)